MSEETSGPIELPTKRCPFCAEEILAAAIKCKHCNSMLNAPPGPPRTGPMPPRKTTRGYNTPRLLGAIGFCIAAALVVLGMVTSPNPRHPDSDFFGLAGIVGVISVILLIVGYATPED
jgi:hypothetical protein